MSRPARHKTGAIRGAMSSGSVTLADGSCGSSCECESTKASISQFKKWEFRFRENTLAARSRVSEQRNEKVCDPSTWH